MRLRRLASGEGCDPDPIVVLEPGVGEFDLPLRSLRLFRILGFPGGMGDAFSKSVRAA